MSAIWNSQFQKVNLWKDDCEKVDVENICHGEFVVEKKLWKVTTEKLNRVKNDKKRSNFELVYLSMKSHDEDMWLLNEEICLRVYKQCFKPSNNYLCTFNWQIDWCRS